jgi:PAS domain S-box-containing protein
MFLFWSRDRRRTRQITEHTQAEQAVRVREARLNFLLAASPAVLYTAQVTDNFATYLSPNIERISGYTPEEFLADPAFWINHLHPQDASRVLAGVPTILEHGHLSQDYRFLMSSGDYRWVRDRSRLVRHDDGSPDEMIGHWVDIHEQKIAEESLDEIRELRGLLPFCAWCKQKILDQDGQWTGFEAYLKRRLGSDITHGICPECFAKEEEKILAAKNKMKPLG